MIHKRYSVKKLSKKVVIATTVGIASMLLNAACGYGPPVQEYDDHDSSYETSDPDEVKDQKDDAEDQKDGTDQKDDSKDNANTLESIDVEPEDYPTPEPEDVYGPPVED